MERPVECYKSIVIYLSLISQKDFKLYILINDICSFALNPSQRNYNALINSLKNILEKERMLMKPIYITTIFKILKDIIYQKHSL